MDQQRYSTVQSIASTNFFPGPDERLRQAWLNEIKDWEERGPYSWEHESAVACAELAEELEEFSDQALDDPDFAQEMYEWDCHLFQHNLHVVLEQCCHEGVLLTPEHRAIRLRHCPEHLLSALNGFLAHCPEHVQHYLALRTYLLVRMSRADATGNPEWRPDKATARSVYEDNAFFRPSQLVFRKYGR